MNFKSLNQFIEQTSGEGFGFKQINQVLNGEKLETSEASSGRRVNFGEETQIEYIGSAKLGKRRRTENEDEDEGIIEHRFVDKPRPYSPRGFDAFRFKSE